MPLYTTLASLSQAAASNVADGSVDAPSTIDQQTNLLASFIAMLRDGSGFTGIGQGHLIGIQLIVSTATYTPTTGTTSILAVGCGGGGAGGGVPVAGGAFASAAGGGGAATWGYKRMTSAFSGLTATIGAPGAAVAGGNGGNGGTTSLGSAIILPGGNGGGSGTPGSLGVSGGGGTLSGIATGADYYFRGSAGAHGVVLSTLSAFSGVGGSTPLGSGGGSNFTNSITVIAGLSGQGAGSGGSGAVAAQNGVNAAGGAGGNGALIIYEYA